ncbi:MAG TPA: winged helix-turn-helix domain-containing protein [Thermoanaerobaculia bacterium]|nr:winged helix-turn-helix domain-containing protein [Thermoanaerobaculia bacterium]
MRYRFGEFELLPASGELFRGGERVPLQHQPAELLALLAREAGRAVSREEIREEIWGAETFVDADQGINYCIRQIRQALEDDAAEPRFVETVPRVGYRFLAPVVVEEGPGAPGEPRRRRSRALRIGAVAAALVAAAAVVAFLVASRVAEDREASTAAPEVAAPRHPLVVPEEAHFRFLEARYLVERAEEDGDLVDASTRAIELLQAVVEEVPEHAEAHAALADAWMMRLDLPRPEAMERAEASARRALELDPTLAEAHGVLAAALFFHRLDWAGAERHAERALELSPGYPDAVLLRALLKSAVGRHDEAIAGARRAARLEPGRLPGISLAWFYFFARRYEEAIVEAERILALRPTDEPSHNVLVYIHLLRGDDAAATRENDRFFHLAWGYPEEVDLQLPGARQLFREWWRNREESLRQYGASPTVIATHGALTGDSEEPVALLRRACEERTASWDLPFVAQDPRWDPLRGEPAFDEVVECVGVPGATPEIPGLEIPGE